MSDYLFESERLGFRKWKHEDRVPFASLNADPLVMEFFPAALTSDETGQFIERIEKRFKEDGFGLWAVEERSSGSFIGFIGLTTATFEAPFTPCTEIGWRLAKEFWGKGYATEGAKRCLSYGFNNFGIDDIYSFTAKTNVRSERVMEKIGMTKIGEFDHPRVAPESPLFRHVLYKISIENI